MLYRSTTRRPQPRRGDVRGANPENERLPMLTIERVKEELDICFTALQYVEGQCPFETQGCGRTSDMVIRFCKRQTDQDNPIRCSIFHNAQKVYQYDPPNATATTPSVVFAVQHEHAYFYQKETQVAPHQRTKTMGKTTPYSCCKVRETFHTDQRPPWSKWKPNQDLVPLMAEGFC